MTLTLIGVFTSRFQSDSSENAPGFQIEYSSIAYIIDCGGNYTKASGILTSPSYPNPYPRLVDCIYLISQRNGTYVNISFISMDVNCQKTRKSYDYIEMRDDNSEDSPLMGRFCGNKIPAPIQSSQNQVWMK